MDEFVRYKKQSTEKHLLWDNWVGLNLKRLSDNSYIELNNAWYEGYIQGERSLDETK